MNFVKMQGTGNDFIFVEDFDNNIKENEMVVAKNVCDRHFGVGADGLVIVRNSSIADIQMIIINSDGSRANMCGNAIRCFGKYIYEKGIIKKDLITVETGDGIKDLKLKINNDKVEYVTVCMGEGDYSGDKIPLNNLEKIFDTVLNINNKQFKASTILVGVPHTVIIDDNNVDMDDGKYIEKSSIFKEGTNVNFVNVINRNMIKVRTWERGAGETLSCGTGCSASVVIANDLGLVDDKVEVLVAGGQLLIEVINKKIFMTGSAKFICEGRYC